MSEEQSELSMTDGSPERFSQDKEVFVLGIAKARSLPENNDDEKKYKENRLEILKELATKMNISWPTEEEIEIAKRGLQTKEN